MIYITYKVLNNIIEDIIKVTSYHKYDYLDEDECLLVINQLNVYRLDKRSEFLENRRNKNTPYNFIPLHEVIIISKPLLQPPFKYPGNIGYAQIENSPSIAVDISKEDRRIVQKLLFDIIGKHHWGVCKLFVLNMYPNHCPESFIDKMYFANRRGNNPLLGSEDGFFFLLEGVKSDRLLLESRLRKQWLKSIEKFYS